MLGKPPKLPICKCSSKTITSSSRVFNELSKYLKDNIYYEAYYKAMNYIKMKLRTEKEIIDYLKKYNYSFK